MHWRTTPALSANVNRVVICWSSFDQVAQKYAAAGVITSGRVSWEASRLFPWVERSGE